LFEIVPREIHFEHAQIATRMSWYVTSQSFLFAAFAISGSAGHRFCWLSRLMPWLGIFTSLLIGLALLAASESLGRLRAYRREIVQGDGALSGLSPLLRTRQEESRLVHFKRKAWIHGLGLAPPLLMPWLFLFCWLLVSAKVKVP
jgi:hypothetical protein